MMDQLERRIRECFDGFLDAVPDDRDLWEIALLEYYRFPLEAWREEPEEGALEIPDCFADLGPALPRLLANKKQICPCGDFASVQANLEHRYVRSIWEHGGDSPLHQLPAQALALLLEFYLLVAFQDDDWGSSSCQCLFEELSDRDVLTRIAGSSLHTPEQQMTLALEINGFYKRWDIGFDVCAWMFELMVDLLEQAVTRDCGEAGWRLYEILVEERRLDAVDDPLWLLECAAEAGSPDAQVEIGSLFVRKAECNGDSGQDDDYGAWYCYGDISPQEAVSWLEKALPRKDGAGFWLLKMFRDGCGVEADEERAIRYCRMVAETRYPEDEVHTGQEACILHLADCYASGRGVPRDRTMAAKLYRQANDPYDFLFDYYRDGLDTPRDPRAAVQWWLRCHNRYAADYLCWGYRLGFRTGEDRPEDLRWLKDPAVDTRLDGYGRTIREEIYNRLEQESDGYRRMEPEYGLFDQERFRLLYDAAQNGDGRCAGILQGLLDRGAVTGETLAKLAPGKCGIYDWPDAWYEEALDLIESDLARKARETEWYRDLSSEILTAEDEENPDLWYDPEDE